ncbi:phosphodiesterase, partial [Candidatus Bathyarchaeota archaeon]|nr:phosphodiesterase [Candidatus Bathyarchaeota archaeon]
NEWLIENGHLALKRYPENITSPTKLEIDWSNTKAWGWGGYYSRIFFNVKNREPNGIILPGDFEATREALRQEIEAMRGPSGEPLGNKTFLSKDLYPDGSIGDDPDLYVYFGDLKWRSAGTVGHQQLFLEENDTGPDDAVHAKHGVFFQSWKRDLEGMDGSIDPNAILENKPIHEYVIYDIFPTIMQHFNIPVPEGLRGTPIST